MSRWLRRHRSTTSTSRVVLCGNKLEGDAWSQMGGGDDVLDSMGRLGFGEPIFISSEHGDGMVDIARVLVEAEVAKREEMGLVDCEGEEEEIWEEGNEPITMAILGRQNVGKSTLLNALVSEDRVITGSVPGLTRDSISVDFMFEDRRKFR